MHAAPLRTARLAALALSFAFGVIGGGVGINALVKFEDEKKSLQKIVPAGATLTIDTDDVLASGIVLTIGCGLVALASAAFFVSALSAHLARRFLRLQAAVLALLSVWTFAVLVPFTDFFANHQAKISAMLGTIPVPESIIQSIQDQVGATPIYRDVPYLRLPAIICWFTFLFAVISTVVCYMAARRVRNDPYPAYANDSEEISEKEKTQARVTQTAA